jgi:TonB family protein
MSPRILASAIIYSLFVAIASSAETQPAKSQKESYWKYVISHPFPKYPYRSRENQAQGKGLCILRIDRETGLVRSVEIERSTGDKDLDRSAIQGFMQWRFVPKTVDAVRIPITFNLIGHQLHWERANAISAPPVLYPLSCQRANIGGTGVYQFIVNFETGEVKDIRIVESAGDGRLDRAALRTFRKWRFRPRTTHDFTTHFSFY